jgi:hypothetical protein
VSVCQRSCGSVGKCPPPNGWLYRSLARPSRGHDSAVCVILLFGNPLVRAAGVSKHTRERFNVPDLVHTTECDDGPRSGVAFGRATGRFARYADLNLPIASSVKKIEALFGLLPDRVDLCCDAH